METAKVVPAGPGIRLPAGQGHGHWRIYNVTDGLAGLDARSIYSDREGNLWFGTWGGVFRYELPLRPSTSLRDGNTFTTFTTKNGLVDNAAWSICQDRKGNIWFGTEGGVSRFDGEGFTAVTTQDGLASNHVLAIAQDKKGFLWFGTENGVSRFDGGEFPPFGKGYMDSLIYTYRIHPLATVIADVQLKYLDKWNEERRRNHGQLSKGLEEIPGIHPVYVSPECKHVYHAYSPTFVPEEVKGVSRGTYVEALSTEGVPIGLGYVRTPIHLRPRMQDKKYFFGKGYPWTCAQREIIYQKGDCSVAEYRCANTELTCGGGPR